MTLIKASKAYSSPIDSRGWAELLLSFAIGIVALAIPAVWPGSVLSLVVGAFLYAIAALRLYSISHDCGHYSYFSNRRMNDFVGVTLGIFTGNTHSAMKYNHNLHHAHLGDLDHRDAHEVFTMTRSEFEAADFPKRLMYRIYRSPLTLFVIGPLWIYFLRYRWPRNADKVQVRDIVFQNLGMFVFWGGVAWLLGWWALFVILLGSYLGGSFGIFAVYVGHNFETAYWAETHDVDSFDAAVTGASVLDLGWLPDFALLNFGYHDLHHLNVRIPSYRLKDCHRALTEHLGHSKITLWEARRCIKWRLWDSDQKRMIKFTTSLRQDIIGFFQTTSTRRA